MGSSCPWTTNWPPKLAWPGVRDPISKFWDPLNISQTGKATIFKFGTHIGRGQFLPRTINWPEIGLRSAGAGAHLAAQLVIIIVIIIIIITSVNKAGVYVIVLCHSFIRSISLCKQDN